MTIRHYPHAALFPRYQRWAVIDEGFRRVICLGRFGVLVIERAPHYPPPA